MTTKKTLISAWRRLPRPRLSNPFDMSIYQLDDLGLSSALPKRSRGR